MFPVWKQSIVQWKHVVQRKLCFLCFPFCICGGKDESRMLFVEWYGLAKQFLTLSVVRAWDLYKRLPSSGYPTEETLTDKTQNIYQTKCNNDFCHGTSYFQGFTVQESVCLVCFPLPWKILTSSYVKDNCQFWFQSAKISVSGKPFCCHHGISDIFTSERNMWSSPRKWGRFTFEHTIQKRKKPIFMKLFAVI